MDIQPPRRPARSAPPTQPTQAPTLQPPVPRVVKSRHRGRRKILIITACVALLAVGGFFAYRALSHPSLVPKNIQKSVSFPVYYPDPQKLPAGYTLEKNSFQSPIKNGVTYKVSYGQGQALTFSIQPKPSDSDLQYFKSNYIPLNNQVQTYLGTAYFGAYNNNGKTESLISLPTNGQPWIIVTGPYNINQDQVKQVLNALKY